MLPRPPPREPSLGFLYIHPYRVQGLSLGGEMTCVGVPELDTCFDIGSCPKGLLASTFVAISHGHMDHIGGLAYFCSQRHFQGLGVGRIICDRRIAQDVEAMLRSYIPVERQVTPFFLHPISPEETIEIKKKKILRAFETDHTVPSLGYVILETRSKLRPEYVGLPHEKLRELRSRNVEIARRVDVPIVAYMGDTAPGEHLLRQDVCQAKIVISECTFFEDDHLERARVGKHMHVRDLSDWLDTLECEALVLTHISRRTNIPTARAILAERLGDRADRVFLLMDHRTNRARYEQQVAEAELRAGV